MPAPSLLDDLAWRKSSFSGSGGNSSGCVEVAPLPDGGMAVRDTKDRSRAAHLHSAPAWQAFLRGIRAGEFNRTFGAFRVDL
jgi:Domain of unknown function (DUF397)